MRRGKAKKKCRRCQSLLPNTNKYFYATGKYLQSECKECKKREMLDKQKNGTYNSYRAAMERCRNPAHTSYKNYGGRGIEFRFKSLEELKVDIGERPDGYSLDRINTNGHYEPGNVRWATIKQQSRNRCNNVVNEITAKLIRQRHQEGWRNNQICACFSLSHHVVSAIIRGKVWNE